VDNHCSAYQSKRSAPGGALFYYMYADNLYDHRKFNHCGVLIMLIFKKIRAVAALCLAAGVMMGATAAVAPQTTQDSAKGNRLVINGKPLFISGMNIAWNSFGNDLKDGTQINEAKFTGYILDIKNAGGNAVRWWLHNDARYCPKVDANGQVTGIANTTISNIRKVLDIAYNNGVVVSLCLFSHNLMKDNKQGTQSIENNFKLFSSPTNMDTYITKGLRPILDSLGNHPAIMCWEVFNEPEGMTTEYGSGWGMYKTLAYDNVITFTAKVAVEVHSRTKKMVSTGIHEFNKTNYFPKYTDANLASKITNSGDKAKAYLDFYMAHFYPEHQGTDMSPFHHKASFWGLTRPVLIGEFPAKSWDSGYNPDNNSIKPGTGLKIVDAYTRAYDSGYCGALSWAMNEAPANKFGDYNSTKPALQALSAAHKADIEIGTSTAPPQTGDLAMKVAIVSLPTGSPYADLKNNGDQNLSGKTNLTFEIFIAPGSGTNLTIIPAIQVGSDWDWKASSQSISLSGRETNKWLKITIPMSTFGANSLTEVKAIVLELQPSGTPYTGTIYIDNVKADNTVISDFTSFSSGWNASKYDGGEMSVEQITVGIGPRPTDGGLTSVITASAKPAPNRAPFATVNGKTLKVTGLDNAEASVKLVSLKGKTIANFRATGNGSFSLADIPAGNYLAELTANGKKLGSSRIVVR